MKREGRAPVLKKSSWLLLRRSENLDAEQHFRLRDCVNCHRAFYRNIETEVAPAGFRAFA